MSSSFYGIYNPALDKYCDLSLSDADHNAPMPLENYWNVNWVDCCDVSIFHGELDGVEYDLDLGLSFSPPNSFDVFEGCVWVRIRWVTQYEADHCEVIPIDVDRVREMVTERVLGVNRDAE